MKQNLVIVALILIVVLMVCGYCQKREQLTYLEEQFSKFELKKQDFKVIVNKNKEKIIEQEQLILTLQQAKNLNLINSKDWKNTKSRIEFVTQTRIDTIFIAFNDTLRINDTIYSKSDFIQLLQQNKIMHGVQLGPIYEALIQLGWLQYS